ncbi:MAG: MraY family glycosyltransferase [Bacteroidota bacterium]|nr:MraY family glycosyltransferase [Bacteroidota bacterium]
MSRELLFPVDYFDWFKLGSAFFCSFLITYLAIPVIVRVSVAKNLFVLPNGRTSHKYATPTLGGIAMFAGIMVSSLLFVNNKEFINFQYALAGCFILFFFGVKDDLTPLTWKVKLFGELLAAFFLIILGDFRINEFGGFLGLYHISYIASVLFTFLVFIGIVNAVNLIDGIDGLAAGLTFLSTSIFGAWFIMTGQIALAVIAISILGMLLAYLGFNVFGTTNKIFMGDTGALLLGYLMTVFVIAFIERNAVSYLPWRVNNAPIVAFAILFIPLFDTLRVMAIRIGKGKSPFSADRNHIHHRLLDLGLTHVQTTMVLVATNTFFIMIAFLMQNLNINLLICVIFALGIIKSFVPVYIRKRWMAKAPVLTPEMVVSHKNVSTETDHSALHDNIYNQRN